MKVWAAMGGKGDLGGVDALVARLEEVGGEWAPAVAAIWTWLEQHPRLLGSLKEKTPAIRDKVLAARTDQEEFKGLGEEKLAWLRKKPIRNAAELLAQIEASLGEPQTPLIVETTGIAGEGVLLAWREPPLPQAINDKSKPPAADEHPSLATLAPRLQICPQEVNGIRVKVLELDSNEGEAAQRELLRGMNRSSGGNFRIHMDTMGIDGMSGLKIDLVGEAGGYDESEIDPGDQERAIAAARDAVRRASDETPSVLLLPELAASDAVREAIAGELRQMPHPPALTIVGLYHADAPDEIAFDPALVKREDLASKVNEAIVLGPSGEVLWHHRKLSSAQAEVEFKGKDRIYAEDIRLGSTLTVVPTPLGLVSVVICLDAFAPHVRERLASSPADVLFVPSLSPHVHRHRDSLRHLVQVLWGIAFVCNRAPVLPGEEADEGNWNSEENRSFWAMERRPELPAPQEPGGHPSFVFDLNRACAELVEEEDE